MKFEENRYKRLMDEMKYTGGGYNGSYKARSPAIQLYTLEGVF